MTENVKLLIKLKYPVWDTIREITVVAIRFWFKVPARYILSTGRRILYKLCKAHSNIAQKKCQKIYGCIIAYQEYFYSITRAKISLSHLSSYFSDLGKSKRKIKHPWKENQTSKTLRTRWAWEKFKTWKAIKKDDLFDNGRVPVNIWNYSKPSMSSTELSVDFLRSQN